MLTTIDRISRTNPFFTKNFSMFDVDSLPEMYETMIDRPALIFDSISNVTYTITKNLTKTCSFFVQRLNYTYEECEEIFNHTVINIDQVRRERIEIETMICMCIYFQQRKKRDLKVGESLAVIMTRKAF